jgi:NTE family protein
MRVGLVLGAGGVMGGAWITGGLEAIAAETGWDPATAEYVVGTSAGSMMGALLAAGVPPWFMVAHSAGDSFEGLEDADGNPAAEADRAAGATFRLHPGPPPIGPGSWKLIANSLSSPMSHRGTAMFAGWLPRGMISNEPLKDTVRRVVPSGWAEHPNLWIVACDYASGRRVAFGRDDAPAADLADAVAASCSIPGFYRPVTIDGRRYVDGGLWSTSNLDILRNEQLDLVICLNPTSSLHPTHAWNPAERMAAAMRAMSGKRLGSEAKKLRAKGTGVVLIQPTSEDIAVMGPNLMSRRNRNPVIETAIRTVAEQLREPGNRELLGDLPAGNPYRVRRPDGPPSTWPPDLLPGHRAVPADAPSRRAAASA